MKTFASYSASLALLCCLNFDVSAQKRDTLIQHHNTDTGSSVLNMDAVYNRPFLAMGKMPVALGGYLEANTLYVSENGVSEGLSFQARRLTLFMSASIANRLKFLSEIEFEDGTKEIAIEFAAMDLVLHPMLNLRGGILMNPIGAFNQNHDGPKWEFVERPGSAETILPATWSNAGFGVYGKTNTGSWVFGYEAYLTNGFDRAIIDNMEGRTSLAATKSNETRFTESANGKPLATEKIAIRHRKLGELGISHMGGVYNNFKVDGIELDVKRRVDAFALDFNTTIKSSKTYLVGELVWVRIDVPPTYTQQYGSKQHGGFLDIVQTIWQRNILNWERAQINLACRLDYEDWNVGAFNETGTNIGDERIAVSPGISLRPSGQTVIRLNYRYQWQSDILDNAPAQTASWLLGFSTYF